MFHLTNLINRGYGSGTQITIFTWERKKTDNIS